MGYYSDVAISMYKSDFDGLVERFKNNVNLDNCERELLRNADEVKRYVSNNDIIVIHWNEIKWYQDSFADVKLIMTYLDYLAENDRPYRFVRVGEDLTDIEMQEHWSDSVESDEVLDKIEIIKYVQINEYYTIELEDYNF